MPSVGGTSTTSPRRRVHEHDRGARPGSPPAASTPPTWARRIGGREGDRARRVSPMGNIRGLVASRHVPKTRSLQRSDRADDRPDRRPAVCDASFIGRHHRLRALEPRSRPDVVSLTDGWLCETRRAAHVLRPGDGVRSDGPRGRPWSRCLDAEAERVEVARDSSSGAMTASFGSWHRVAPRILPLTWRGALCRHA